MTKDGELRPLSEFLNDWLRGKLKKLDANKPLSNDIDDVVYNLNCLIGYFNAFDQYDASNTVLCAEQVIKNIYEQFNESDR
jgi:hypothetical protein